MNCELCEFKCIKIGDWTRHIATRKHCKNFPLTTKNIPSIKQKYPCLQCSNLYATRQGLWRHNQKCKPTYTNNLPHENIQIELLESDQESVPEQSSDDNNTHITNEMMCEILKELCISNAKNTEFQAKFFEFMKEKQFSNNITNNVQINIDTFLNQYCKDAPSMNDFIKNIKVSVEEMFYMGKKGYKGGLIFILDRILGEVELAERPFHCTDPKRHTTYVKDDTGWTKSHDQKPLLKLCDNIGSKCNTTFYEFSTENPNYRLAGTPECEIGVNIVVESHGGISGGADQFNTYAANYVEGKYHLDKDQMKTAIMNK
jgi:hypothetical protein